MKKLYLLAFLGLIVFASGCGKSGDETTQSKNENTHEQQVKDESEQNENQQTKTGEKTTMNNSGEYKTIEIKTKGMSCSHCENTIKTSVEKLDGVKEVIADAKTNTAKVTFDDGKTSLKEIENAITDAGYGVEEPVQ